MAGRGDAMLWTVANGVTAGRIVMVIVFAVSPPSFSSLAVLLLSFILDLVDGMLARRLGQTSKLGAILDILADNLGRSAVWAKASGRSASVHAFAVFFISLEWVTLFATQMTSHLEGGRHWKQQTSEEPWMVRAYFKNNFKNPLGTSGILGLFLLPTYIFIDSQFPSIASSFPPSLWLLVGVWLLLGRLASACLEMYFTIRFFRRLLSPS
ncbi:hypothetical protein GUITHDRAFT_102442 [Guillardia theta CCMP2712]|uniref:CDP-diacylglycerol--inositol 3-phosphatidyltransferase n=1 Tax=Guillardia theta (strain CCMP2712) TaxID=905079 RepID=L1JTF8_GUITC|nr:hypothetical protein GUITHDRAFT_102442 [Guillardia theta CCMP2712]EKX51831.1 hypothetical protein GUITHDRAFT_102442 [Guillardia theta CCMP2712]|eukprot:XP_005838811.1 hypothetical protein GUITHDRAFT_102442 [Guillardia theta CCMP2712]